MENAQNKHVIHHFGGMLAMKFGLHLKTGTFAESACFQVPKNGPLDAKTKTNGDHCLMPTSPENGGLHVCFVHFPLWVLSQFKNLAYNRSFSQQHNQKNKNIIAPFSLYLLRFLRTGPSSGHYCQHPSLSHKSAKT